MITINLTPKQDKFCQVFIETGNASEAYRQAYNTEKMKKSSINRKAVEVLENVKITARLDEIRGIHAERHNITVGKLTGMYMATYHQALAINSPSAAAAAVAGLGKLHGLINDRGIIEHRASITHEHTGISEFNEWLEEWNQSGQGKPDEGSSPK